MTKITPKSEHQKDAEAEVAAFRNDLGPFVVAAETTRMPMAFTDATVPGDPIVFANDSLLALTGYERAELLGKPLDFLMADPADLMAGAQSEATLPDGPEDTLDVRCRRKDGGVFWAGVFIGPVRDARDEIVQHFVSITDLTRHKTEQEHLRLLLSELNHRTQNTLATVQVIATQTFRDGAHGDAVTFQGRIQALASVHGLLGREDWLAVGLGELIEQILRPFGLRDGDGDRMTVDGPEARLPPKTALTLALVFEELATNAAKYGALSTPAGKIRLSWTIASTDRGERMRILWTESGGPPVTPPARKGFGSRLIEGGLAQELGGEVHLDYAPSGVVCRIDMPAPQTLTLKTLDPRTPAPKTSDA
jgi:PAS domain S-box-containing protein